MLKRLPVILLLLIVLSAVRSPAAADDRTAGPKIQEEIWALPFPLPVLAFRVRPVGDGPFPLVGHEPRNFSRRQSADDVSHDRISGRCTLVRASRLCGHLAYQVRGSSLDDKDQGIYGAVFGHVGSCDNPNFRGPGLAIATLNEWVIDYMSKKKMIQPGKVVVVGQSGGGWGSIALASLNPSSVQAIPLQPGAEAALIANPTTIALPISSLPQPASLDAPHAYQCSGSTRKTTPISGQS
ncbi:hypothetical protein [Bradyrhizobium japonicum]|uniref:hypothetical protein n=1 Tax=Bradyrhizobium japonicum TaxID=375 RepID=UPI0034E3CEE7